MRRAVVLAALLFAVGCGGAEGPAETADAGGLPGPDGSTGKQTQDLYQSGSRLKARMLVTADGAKSFNGWRDTKRGENCTFAPTTDGKTRCIPTGCAGATISSRMYADENCTGNEIVPFFGATPSCVSLTDAATRSVAIFTEIAPTAVGATVYLDADPTKAGCTSSQASSLYPGGFVKLVQGPVSPSEFVEGVERLE